VGEHPVDAKVSVLTVRFKAKDLRDGCPPVSPFRWNRLSDYERRRAEVYSSRADRVRSATSAVLLREAVARVVDVRFEQVEVRHRCLNCTGMTLHGQPYVAAPPGSGLHISVSHSGDSVAVALSRLGPLGVDVESVSATSFDAFDAVALTDIERRTVARLPAGRQANEARTRLWTRKEALLKASGKGLMADPASVSVITGAPFTVPPQLQDVLGADGRLVHLRNFRLGFGVVGAVAVVAVQPPRFEFQSVDDTGFGGSSDLSVNTGQ
jgi:4'-phosphopantetheinyl transferase